jgi:hypothetical protein
LRFIEVKMKQLILTLCMVLVCGSAWGAMYKISPTGDGSDGSTWAKAYQTIQAAVTAHHVAGDIYDIDGGASGITYNESVNAEWGVPLAFRRSAESGHTGTVIINGTSAAITLRVDGGTTVDDLTLINLFGASSRYAIGAKTATFNRCVIGPDPPDRVTTPDIRNVLMLAAGAYTATFNRCTIRGCGTTRNMVINATNVVNINTSIITDNWGPIFNSGILTTNNNTIIGNGVSARVIDQQTGSTYTSNNDIFAGNNLNNSNFDVVNNVGTIAINNSVLLPHPIQPATYNFGGTKNNIVSATPKIKTGRRGGYASIVVDDSDSTVDYFLQVASQAESNGVRAAIALSIPSAVSEPNWALLRAAAASGHEILNHTMTHPNLSITTGITIVGPANSTVDLSVTNSNADPALWTGTIDCKVSGVSVGTVDIASNGSYPTPTLAAARINTLLGGAGWTATATASGGVNSLMAALTGASGVTATGGGAVFSWDYPKYIYYEVGWAKKIIEQKMGEGGTAYECKMFAYSGGAYTATVKGLMYNASTYPAGINQHIGARSLGTTKSWTLSSDYTSGTGTLAGLQIWEIYALHPANLSGNSPTDALITARWSAWAEWLKFIGGVGMTYMHISSTDGATYYPPETVGKIIRVLVDAGVNVQTPTQIVTNVRDSGLWSDADANGTRWTRVYTDQSDYRLKSSSPAKNAGIDVGLTTDYLGNPIRGLPDIGAYEYKPVGNNGLHIGPRVGL